MSDDRPSLRDMRAWWQATERYRDKTGSPEPVGVLLEIAEAALVAHGPCDHPEGRCGNGSHFRGCPRFDGEKRLRAALAKVRP